MPSEISAEMVMERPLGYEPAKLSRLSEKILMSLCRDPSAPDYPGGTLKTNVDNSLDFLRKTVPDLDHYLRGKILDFGCGWGYQSIAKFERIIRGS